jgi:cobalt-precorrin-5B (C1)-methyltransferase
MCGRNARKSAIICHKLRSQFILMKPRKTLRTGYTTGTCAAAAAKGALLGLLGKRAGEIEVDLPYDKRARIVPRSIRRKAEAGLCEVVKDAGDDPDITNGAVIRADVKLLNHGEIIIKAGPGVGVVTRPGLAVLPGEPAINPVPRKMIRNGLHAVLPEGKGAEVCISVADGEALAGKTLNPRLGIVGGISILGTTGIVVPYSHEAYRESIICALDVIKATGLDTVVFSTGKSSERTARNVFPDLPEPAFVLMADYFLFAVEKALEHDIKGVIISCFPGKLLKMASGAGCTHYSKSSIDLKFLADIAKKEGRGREALKYIAGANTVRHAFSLMPDQQKKNVCAHMAGLVAKRIKRETQGSVKAEVLVLSYKNEVLYHGR